MKIAHLYPFTGKDKGGIAACLPPLLNALLQQNLEVELWAQRWPGDGALEDLPFETVRVPTKDRSGFGYSPALRESVRRGAAGADVLHSHGLWMWSDYLASQTARAHHKPHVVSPHGMLEPWALANSARKKRLMRRLFQDRALQNARVLHALCAAERDAMRALGLQNPIATIPNGVNLSDFATLPNASELEARFPAIKNRRVLLFMARLHPKKGLLPLLESWQKVASAFPDWLLVIAGPDEGGHRAELETAVAALNLQNAVLFTGMLDGALKSAALARAQAFVLPSWSEGFSIAVLEAMACHLPVLLTPHCHFPDAVSEGAALEAPPQSAAFDDQLRALLQMSDTKRAAMGARGHALVAQSYSWERAAADFKRLYGWCCESGAMPDFVECD